MVVSVRAMKVVRQRWCGKGGAAKVVRKMR